MKKRIVCFLIVMALLASTVMNVNAIYYRPGPTTYVIETESCVESENVTFDSGKIIAKDGGYVVFDYSTTLDATSMTINYTAKEDTSIIVEPEGYVEKKVLLQSEKTTATYDFFNVQTFGDHYLTLRFNGDVTIESLTLNAMQYEYSTHHFTERQVLNLTDSQRAISSAVLVDESASIILVNGGKRFVDDNDRYKKPEVIDGEIYLPIKTLSRALGYYYEEILDRDYCLLRKEQVTFTYRDGAMTRQDGHGELESVDVKPREIDGTYYLPIKFFAESAGETVASHDGITVIDGRHAVNDILESKETLDYIKSEFAPYTAEYKAGTTYHVAQSENASDDNPGTAEAPFLTLKKAGEVAAAGDTVIIHAGIYREILAPQNSGTAESPIIFTAAEGESVTISAADEVDRFVDMGNGMVAAKLNWDLGDGRNQIFYNDKCIIEARYPNGPGIEMSEDGEPLSELFPVVGDFKVDDMDASTVTSSTLLDQEEKDYWKGSTYVSMHGYGWTLNEAKVASSSKGKLTLSSFTSKWWFDPSSNNVLDYGYLTGSIRCMDLPGEWVVRSDTLWMIPPEGETAETLKVDVKRRQIVIDLTDRNFITVKGIKTIGGSVLMPNSEMCTLDSMDMSYISHFTTCDNQRDGFIVNGSSDTLKKHQPGSPQFGEMGMYIGGYDNRITNSKIDHSAGAAMILVGMFAYIENNIISNCGYMGCYIGGISVSEPNDQKDSADPKGGFAIYNNTIYNVGRSALMVQMLESAGWDKANELRSIYPFEVAYNDFHDAMLSALDGGTTYEYQVNGIMGNLVSTYHNNYVYYTYPKSPVYSMGIYHDGNTEGYFSYENIVFTTQKNVTFSHGYMFTHGGIPTSPVWMNSELKRVNVEGGPENLQIMQFPYGQPFYAGSYLGQDEPFLRNYNSEADELKIYYAKDAELQSNAKLDKYDSVTLSQSGDAIRFSDVDFTDMNVKSIRLYFRADRFKPENKFDISVIGESETAKYNVSFRSRANNTDDFDTATFYIGNTSGINDVEIKFLSGGPISIEGISVGEVTEKIDGHDGSCVAGGDFDSIVSTGGTTPSQVFSATGYYSAKDLWGGTTLKFKNVNIPKDSTAFYSAIGTSSPHDGQTVSYSYTLPGSDEKKPIAEFKTTNNGWNTNTDLKYAELPEDFPKDGKVDILVSFIGSGKTCNLFTFGFSPEIPEKVKEQEAKENDKTPLHDGEFVHGGDFDKVLAKGSATPSKVVGSNDRIYVKDTWPGTILLYDNVTIPKDAKVFYAAIGVSSPYDGEKVVFNYTIPGSNDKIKIGETTTVNNGWDTSDDYIYFELKDPIPSDVVDIYVEFSGGTQTCNFYSFGFSAEIPE